MRLEEAVFQFLDRAKKTNFTGTEYEQIVIAFSQVLEECTDKEDFYPILTNWDIILHELPVEIGMKIYNQLLKVSNTPSDLRSFAFYRQLRGPDWDEIAEKMLDIVKFIE
jgi:hypothetical protein